MLMVQVNKGWWECKLKPLLESNLAIYKKGYRNSHIFPARNSNFRNLVQVK